MENQNNETQVSNNGVLQQVLERFDNFDERFDRLETKLSVVGERVAAMESTLKPVFGDTNGSYEKLRTTVEDHGHILSAIKAVVVGAISLATAAGTWWTVLHRH